MSVTEQPIVPITIDFPSDLHFPPTPPPWISEYLSPPLSTILTATSNSKIESLASRLVEPNDPRRNRDEDEDDDEAIFAELEAEIENDGSYSMREQGLDVFKRE